MLTDPIADFINRLKNASRAKKESLTVIASKLIKNLANLIATKGFVDRVEVNPEKSNEITIFLKDGRAELAVKRVSKPGQRIYVGYQQIKRVRSGLGMAVISTSKGLIAGEEAYAKKLGGEYICEIY
jgi:small subunit ribosomal protein S8